MRNGIVMLVLVAATAALLYALIQPASPAGKSYSQFEQDVKSGRVSMIVRSDTTLTVTLNDANKTTYTVQSDSPAAGEWAAIQSWAPSAATDVSYTVNKPADTGWIVLIATTIVPIVIVVLFIAFFMRQAQGTNNQALSFG